MSEQAVPELSPAVRESTLAHFAEHRRAWQSNPALRMCYRSYYGRLRAALPAPALGPWVEVGSGPGLAAEFIPELVLTDIVQAPWHGRRAAAEALPFGDGEVGAVVLFDVLHHVAEPAAFFAEAARVLRPGGRIVLLEPYISPLSRVIYGLFHPELVDMSVDPFAPSDARPADKDPFQSNQALPTLLFSGKWARRLAGLFPQLTVTRVERFAGLSYPATGGFSRRPLLPMLLWRALFTLDSWLPRFLFRLIGFRLLVVIEKKPTP